jgi:hypothetical protein
MATSSFVRAPRCSIVNLTSGESMDVLFNPEQLVEKIGVQWSRVTVPGLSFKPLQFQSTDNRQLPGVEFYLDKYFARSQNEDASILDFRGFLRAFTVPPAVVKGVPAAAPPRALFVWPSLLSVECVFTSLQFTYKKFSALDGSPLIYTAVVDFEEILDTRVTSEELRRDV